LKYDAEIGSKRRRTDAKNDDDCDSSFSGQGHVECSVGVQQRDSGKWRARLRIKSELVCIGTYNLKSEAQVAFDTGADYRDSK